MINVDMRTPSDRIHLMAFIDVILLLGLGVLIALVWRNQNIRSGDPALEIEKSEKNKLAGQNKQMFAEQISMKEDIKSLTKERDLLAKSLAQYEAKKEQHDKQFARELQDLTNAKQKFEQEQQRVTREDEEKNTRTEAERDRIWAEHEQTVIDRITNLCKQPQYAFTCFTNTNLPEGFNVKPKPDCLIEFLDQYIVFDAKKSKSESLKAYIDRTIKDTVEKFKKQPKIASTVFLVVPTEALGELKSHHFIHDGYTFYVVSTEALAPILASLKKITTYEFADQMDPQQRENIVQYIAEMDFHINLQNATNIILTKHGVELLEKAHAIDPEIAEEVALKKQPMNAKASIAAADLKKIVASLTEQNLEIQQIVSPKASVKKKNLKAAEEVILESML